MCDENTEQDNEKFLRDSSQQSGGITRRQFGTITTAAALATLLPRAANAQTVNESDVTIQTPDGTADCYFVHPAKGTHPGVLIWPDIIGLRPAFRLMGKRLAESGYSVLVVNPYYRVAKAPVVGPGASFADPEIRGKLLPMARQLSAETVVTDANAFVAFLDRQGSVNTQRKIGTMGYCMGGPFTMLTAAALPDRIGAGASFHGGGLVTDSDDSPHLLVPKMQSHYLIAIAANDDERQPEAKDILKKSFKEAGLPAEIEVYEGAMHGWCPPDSRVYNEVQAERAWSRLLNLLNTALA